MGRIGIFLDRDGTINEEVDYLSSPNDLRLIDGSADAIRIANELGVVVCVVTNQSGIARGILTEQQLEVIHDALRALLARHNAHVDAIYYCPHHPTLGDARYRNDCDCRKPNTGMITRAVKEFGIDTKQSFVIGDRMIDIQLGNAIGATPILVKTGYGSVESANTSDQKIAYIAENLYDAMQFVKQKIHVN